MSWGWFTEVRFQHLFPLVVTMLGLINCYKPSGCLWQLMLVLFLLLPCWECFWLFQFKTHTHPTSWSLIYCFFFVTVLHHLYVSRSSVQLLYFSCCFLLDGICRDYCFQCHKSKGCAAKKVCWRPESEMAFRLWKSSLCFWIDCFRIITPWFVLVCVHRASVGSDCTGSDGRGSGSAEGRAGDAEAAIRYDTHTCARTHAHAHT